MSDLYGISCFVFIHSLPMHILLTYCFVNFYYCIWLENSPHIIFERIFNSFGVQIMRSFEVVIFGRKYCISGNKYLETIRKSGNFYVVLPTFFS